MYKKLSSFLLVLTFSISNLCFFTHNANAAELTEKDKKFAQVPYIAWQEMSKYNITSNINLNISIHASNNFSKDSINNFVKGVKKVADQYSGVFKQNDTIHLIFATNYEDASRLVKEVNLLMPDYESYNERHLLVAKENFVSSTRSMGGTSSRGCNVVNGKYGDRNNQVIPCPELNGGVIYWWDENPNAFQFEELTGGHEISHIVLTKLNKMSHYRVPDWIIEGTMQNISQSALTEVSNLKKEGTLFTPIPTWIPFEFGKNYDLAKMNGQSRSYGDDVYSIGGLAISLLVSEVGAKKFFEFMSKVGYPKKWEEFFLESFGFSAEDFYKKFSDYHAWYFYENGFQVIQSTNYFGSTKTKTTISCIKGKTTKKVTGVNPMCPGGYKKK